MELDPLICHTYMFERRGKSKMAPKGCFTVYVGEDQERFVVPINYLQSAYFVELLKEAGEVYGFDQKGPLKLPCSVERVHKVLNSIQKENEKLLGRVSCV